MKEARFLASGPPFHIRPPPHHFLFNLHSCRGLRSRAAATSEALSELQLESKTSPVLGGQGDGPSGDDPLSACQLGKFKHAQKKGTYILNHYCCCLMMKNYISLI